MKQHTSRNLSRLLVCLAATGGAFALPLLAAPRIALAQSDPSVEIARQRFREGVGFYDQREYEKARLAFLQAYALKPHPAVLLNLAQSELRAGYPADAANHFGAYIRENPQATEAERQEAELGFAAAKSKAGAVEVAVDVEGADILVDGEKKGRSPMDAPIYLSPGKHTLEAKTGTKAAQTSVSVEAGDSVGATLRLTSGGSAAAAAPTTTAAAPPAEDAPPDEPVEDDFGGEFEADSSDTEGFFAWYGDRPLAWVLTGVGVGGIAGGVVGVLSSQNSYDRADTLKAQLVAEFADDRTFLQNLTPPDPILDRQAACKRNSLANERIDARIEQGKSAAYDAGCQQFEDEVSKGDLYQVLGIVGFGVGGAALVGTVVYYVLDSGNDSAQTESDRFRARVTPVMGDGYRGLSVTGQF